MKTYEVILTKSYILKIKANNEDNAKAYSEYFTNDIQSMATIEDEMKYKFKIENIVCMFNETFDVIEIHDNN